MRPFIPTGAADPAAAVPAAKGVVTKAVAAVESGDARVLVKVPMLGQPAVGGGLGHPVNVNGAGTGGGQRADAGAAVASRFGGQPGVDTKGFTGRGAQRRLRDARAEVDRIHAEMELMVDRTLEVPGHAIRLCLHKRAKFQQLSLRWRESHGTRAHLSWDEVGERISTYPRALMLWYQQANVLSQRLNAKERTARAVLRKAREDLSGLEGELGPLI